MAAANLTAPITLRVRGGTGEVHAFPVETDIVIYNGSLVWLDNTTGRLTNGSAGSNDSSNFSSDLAGGTGFRYDFVGVATLSGNSVTGAEDSAGSPTVFCPVNTGGLVLEGVMCKDCTADTSVGNYVLPSGNDVNTQESLKIVAATTNSNRAIGFVIRWHSITNQDVKLYSMDASKVAGKTNHVS